MSEIEDAEIIVDLSGGKLLVGKLRERIKQLQAELKDSQLDGQFEKTAFDAAMKIGKELLAENELIKGLIQMALNELGVPSSDYPAPVLNAVDFLKEALKRRTNKQN